MQFIFIILLFTFVSMFSHYLLFPFLVFLLLLRLTSLYFLLGDGFDPHFTLRIRAGLAPLILLELPLHLLVAPGPLLAFRFFPGFQLFQHHVQLLNFITNVTYIFLQILTLLRLRVVISCYFLLQTGMQMIGFHSIC